MAIITFVNKSDIKNSGRKVLTTWVKGSEYDALWETDFNNPLVGDVKTDWKSMTNNLLEAGKFYNLNPEFEEEYEVTVNYERSNNV